MSIPESHARKSILAIVVALALGLFAALPAMAGPDLACSKEVAKEAVHCVAVGLGQILAGQSDEKQKQETIRRFIDQIRFYPDQSGYFYVYDLKCTNVAHAIQKDLQGKNLVDHKDVKGKYVVRRLADAAKKGGGFVEFHWAKPGAQGEHPKLGYVEPIPGTDYFIGSGVYQGE